MKRSLLLLLMLLVSGGNTLAEQVYSFGIVPQQSASKLAQLWGPILQRVNQQSGIKLQFATAPDIPTFENRLAAGEYDFAYMNPYHYTIFQQAPGYQALAKARDKRIEGIIVVHNGPQGTQTLQQLNNRTLAFPSPAAFAASILTRSHLAGLNINFTPNYVSSHDSVYRAVAKGLYPAGGGIMRTFNNLSPEIREQLRVIWTSNGYTPHAIASHPRTQPQVVKKLQQALIQLEQSTEGKRLLYGIKLKGFEAASNADWDDVRTLHIEQLSDL